MTTPRIIGLWSPAPGCGKTTVANLLGDHHYVRVGFADPLRRMAIELLTAAGYEWSTAYRLVTEEKGMTLGLLPGAPTSRQLLRTLGTEWGRDLVHPDLWIGIWTARARSAGYVVADDVRFPNEAARVLALGGEIWAVLRPGCSDDSGHRSEAGLSEVTFARVIKNVGTIEDLRRQVEGALA